MKNSISPTLMVLGIVFCACLIASNLFSMKLLAVGALTVSAGVVVFPISYIVNDCIAEVWGFAKARWVIWLGFAVNAGFLALGAFVVWLPAAPFWNGQGAFESVFGLAPRIAVASLAAFLLGSLVNARIMSRLKQRTQGRHFGLRAIASTVVGESVDSLVFYPIAFAGLIPAPQLAVLMLSQVVLKTLFEIVVLPITARFVRYLKAREQLDTFDTNGDYRLFRFAF